MPVKFYSKNLVLKNPLFSSFSSVQDNLILKRRQSLWRANPDSTNIKDLQLILQKKAQFKELTENEQKEITGASAKDLQIAATSSFPAAEVPASDFLVNQVSTYTLSLKYLKGKRKNEANVIDLNKHPNGSNHNGSNHNGNSLSQNGDATDVLPYGKNVPKGFIWFLGAQMQPFWLGWVVFPRKTPWEAKCVLKGIGCLSAGNVNVFFCLKKE